MRAPASAFLEFLVSSGVRAAELLAVTPEGIGLGGEANLLGVQGNSGPAAADAMHLNSFVVVQSGPARVTTDS